MFDDESTGDPDFEGSSVQGSDHGYAIRRFLLDTESILDDDLPEAAVPRHLESSPDERPRSVAPTPRLEQPREIVSPRQDLTTEAKDIALVIPIAENGSRGAKKNQVDTKSPNASGSAHLAKISKPDRKASRIYVWNKTAVSASYDKVFGVSLRDSYVTHGDLVPAFVCRCIETLDLHGLEVNMIYSLTGKVSTLEGIKSVFDRGEFQQ